MESTILKGDVNRNNNFLHVFLFAVFALCFFAGVSAEALIEPIDTSEAVEVDKIVAFQTTVSDLIYTPSCELRIKRGTSMVDSIPASASGLVVSADYTFELTGTFGVYFRCLDKDMNPRSGSESELEIRSEIKEPTVEELDMELPVQVDVSTVFQTTANDASGIDGCVFVVEDNSENPISEEKASVSTPCTDCTVSESFRFDEIGSYFVYFSCTDNEGNEGSAEKELIWVKDDAEEPVVSRITAPALIMIGEKQKFEVQVSDNEEVTECWFVVENANEDQIAKKSVSVWPSCDSCAVKYDYAFNSKNDFYVYFSCTDAELNTGDGAKTKISKDTMEYPQVLSLVSKYCSSIDDDSMTTCTVRIKDFSDGVKCRLYENNKPKEDYLEMERDCGDSVDGCDCDDEECTCSEDEDGCVYEFKEVFKFFSVQYPSVSISCVNNEGDELDRLVQSFSIGSTGSPTYFNIDINGKWREHTNSRDVYLLVSARGAVDCAFRNSGDDYTDWINYEKLFLSSGIRDPWVLPDSDGEKTVCGKCRSEDDTETSEKCDSIFLDTKPPDVILTESGDFDLRIFNESRDLLIPAQIKAVVSDSDSGVSSCRFRLEFDSQILADVFTKVESDACFYNLPTELADLELKEGSLLKLTSFVFDNAKNKSVRTLVLFGTDTPEGSGSVDPIDPEDSGETGEEGDGELLEEDLVSGGVEDAEEDPEEEQPEIKFKHAEELGEFLIVVFEPSSIKGVKRGDYADVLVELRGDEFEDQGINLVVTGPSKKEYSLERNYSNRFFISKRFEFDKNMTVWPLEITAFDGYGKKLNANTIQLDIPLVDRFEEISKDDGEGILLKTDMDFEGNKIVLIEKDAVGYQENAPERIMLIPLDKYGNQLVDLDGNTVTLEAVGKEDNFEFELESYLLKMTNQLQISDEFGNSSKIKVVLEGSNLVESTVTASQGKDEEPVPLIDISQAMSYAVPAVAAIALIVLVVLGFKAKDKLLFFYGRKKARERMLKIKEETEKGLESMDKFVDRSKKDVFDRPAGKGRDSSGTGISLDSFEKDFREVSKAVPPETDRSFAVKSSQSLAADSVRNIEESSAKSPAVPSAGAIRDIIAEQAQSAVPKPSESVVPKPSQGAVPNDVKNTASNKGQGMPATGGSSQKPQSHGDGYQSYQFVKRESQELFQSKDSPGQTGFKPDFETKTDVQHQNKEVSNLSALKKEVQTPAEQKGFFKGAGPEPKKPGRLALINRGAGAAKKKVFDLKNRFFAKKKDDAGLSDKPLGSFETPKKYFPEKDSLTKDK